MTAHTIRLHGAWDTTPDSGRIRHARKFGRPRTLDANERVWLVCGFVPGPVAVSVNGELIGAADAPGPFAADVTPVIQFRNEVVFVVASDEPLGECNLEIRIPRSAMASDPG